MIDYPRGRWLPLTLALRGTVLPRTLGWVAGLAAATLALRLYTQWAGIELNVPPLAHSLIGVALGLLLVFRTNASYDRYWEGRKQWGGIVNASRNLARAASAYAAPATELATLIPAFAVALKQHLRSDRDLSALPAPLAATLATSANPPTLLTREMTRWIAARVADGALDPQLARTLDASVTALVDHQGACERILKTPVPFAYVVHIRQLLLLYLLTLPFVLVQTLGALAPVAVAFIAMGLMGIEEIGVEIEEPFGTDPNDLPIEAMCATIERDVTALIHS
ncbi:MAG: bestrophin family ion channel [bacterium]